MIYHKPGEEGIYDNPQNAKLCSPFRWKAICHTVQSDIRLASNDSEVTCPNCKLIMSIQAGELQKVLKEAAYEIREFVGSSRDSTWRARAHAVADKLDPQPPPLPVYSALYDLPHEKSDAVDSHADSPTYHYIKWIEGSTYAPNIRVNPGEHFMLRTPFVRTDGKVATTTVKAHCKMVRGYFIDWKSDGPYEVET